MASTGRQRSLLSFLVQSTWLCSKWLQNDGALNFVWFFSGPLCMCMFSIPLYFTAVGADFLKSLGKAFHLPLFSVLRFPSSQPFPISFCLPKPILSYGPYPIHPLCDCCKFLWRFQQVMSATLWANNCTSHDNCFEEYHNYVTKPVWIVLAF